MFGNGPFDFSQFQQPQMPTNSVSPLLGEGLGTPEPTDPSQPQHHGGFGGILPYLAMGLLGSHLLGGGAMGQMAPLFGLGGILAKKAGLFK